jgi:hypothetical protein
MVKMRHVRYPYTDGLIECAALLIIHSSEIRTVTAWQQVQALIIAGWCIPKSSSGLWAKVVASERQRTECVPSDDAATAHTASACVR